MKNLIFIPIIGLGIFLLPVTLHGQSFKFYYSNDVKFLKAQSADTLKMPFTGGMNAPQLSNIDLNGDGVMDLYIFDRSGNKSLTFLRKNNAWEYTPSYDGKFPPLTDWVQLKDFDADGRMDIFTEVTMDKAYAHDTIQDVTVSGLRILRNIPGPSLTFKAVSNQVMDTGGVLMGMPVEDANIYINNTDIAGIGDMDGDGDADILPFVLSSLSPNYYENYMVNKHGIPYSHDSTRFIWRDQCWGYMMYDRTYKTNSFELGLTKDEMSSCFYQMYEKHSMHTNNSVCIMDYNGDGVSDLLYGDGGFTNLLLLVNGRNQNSLGRDSIVSQDTMFPSNGVRANFIIFPIAYYVDVDGDGVNELTVTTNEPNAAKSLNNVWVYENTGTTAKPTLTYSGNNFFAYDEAIDVGTRAAPTLVDIDADGDEDLIVGTSGDYEKTHNFNDRLVWYKNTGKVNGRSVFQLADTNFLMLSKDTPVLAMQPTFADLNNDGKKDLIIGDMNGYLLYYTNNSSGNAIQFTLQTRTLGDIDAGSYVCPSFYDMDKDGDLDLVCGNRNGYLRYYQNSGTAASPQFSSTPTLDSLGKVRVNRSYTSINGQKITDVTGFATPQVYDLDGDSNPEIITGSQYGQVYVYTNVSLTPGAVFTRNENIFVDYSNRTNAYGVNFGIQSRPCIGMLDEDNKPDMFIGNIRGGITYYSSLVNKDSVVGLHEAGAPQVFRAYPNPAHDRVNIAYHNLNHSGTYRMYNQIGQLMREGILNHYLAETAIELSGLTEGIYFIRIEADGHAETLKVIRHE